MLLLILALGNGVTHAASECNCLCSHLSLAKGASCNNAKTASLSEHTRSQTHCEVQCRTRVTNILNTLKFIKYVNMCFIRSAYYAPGHQTASFNAFSKCEAMSCTLHPASQAKFSTFLSGTTSPPCTTCALSQHYSYANCSPLAAFSGCKRACSAQHAQHSMCRHSLNLKSCMYDN